MALDALNSKRGPFPNDQYKADAMMGTAAGLEKRKSRYIGKGFDFKK